MAIDLQADLTTMFSGSLDAVSVSFGNLTTLGLEDRETDPQDLGGHLLVNGETWSVAIAPGSLPGLKKGSLLTVNGVPAKAQSSGTRLKDGFLVIWLEEP
jgi:hypothetical protein